MSTESKKIASFMRGLGPKLLKTMGRTKCATFNEFVSDALTQENYNTVYTSTKTRKRAFEAGAGASQSKAPVAARPKYMLQLLTSGIARQRRRIRRRRGSARGTPLLFLGATMVPTMPRLHLPTVRARTVIRQGTSKATVLTRQRRAIKGTSVKGMFTIQLWKQSLLVR